MISRVARFLEIKEKLFHRACGGYILHTEAVYEVFIDILTVEYFYIFIVGF